MNNSKLPNLLNGFLLALQFFTIIPIRKEIEMNERTVPWMVGSMPLIGFIIGVVTIVFVEITDKVFTISPLITAFLLLISFIMWTGGLHLDGWTDVSDAFFSYQDFDNRHRILKDPRVGAFGVLSLVVLLATKAFVLIDISYQFGIEVIWFLWIPVLSRLMLSLLLIRMPLAREDGLAYFLRQSVKRSHIAIPFVLSVLLLAVPFAFVHVEWQLMILLMAGWFIYLIGFIRFAKKEFGGITGDLLGACLEGGELWSVILVWCYLSIAMV